MSDRFAQESFILREPSGASVVPAYGDQEWSPSTMSHGSSRAAAIEIQEGL
jgi:hypothetical protein